MCIYYYYLSHTYGIEAHLLLTVNLLLTANLLSNCTITFQLHTSFPIANLLSNYTLTLQLHINVLTA